jgi:hypothetical protein
MLYIYIYILKKMGNTIGSDSDYNPHDSNVFQMSISDALKSDTARKRACCMSSVSSTNLYVETKMVGTDGKVYRKKLNFKDDDPCIVEGSSYKPDPPQHDTYDPAARNRCDAFYKGFCEKNRNYNSGSGFKIKKEEGAAATNATTWKISEGGTEKTLFSPLDEEDIHYLVEDCNCLNGPFGDAYQDNPLQRYPTLYDTDKCTAAHAYKRDGWDPEDIPNLQICQQTAIELDEIAGDVETRGKISQACNFTTDTNSTTNNITNTGSGDSSNGSGDSSNGNGGTTTPSAGGTEKTCLKCSDDSYFTQNKKTKCSPGATNCGATECCKTDYGKVGLVTVGCIGVLIMFSVMLKKKR